MPPISASIYTSLPQLGSFAKCRDPSYTLLYRFSYGYSRCTCAFSYGQVARELRMSAKKAEQVLAQLEARKLIETLFPPFKKFRGKVYKVKLPREFVREHETELTVTEAFQTLRNMGLL
jgi:hypothetical protein